MSLSKHRCPKLLSPKCFSSSPLAMKPLSASQFSVLKFSKHRKSLFWYCKWFLGQMAMNLAHSLPSQNKLLSIFHARGILIRKGSPELLSRSSFQKRWKLLPCFKIHLALIAFLPTESVTKILIQAERNSHSICSLL